MAALIWLGVTGIVIAIAEVITLRRRRQRLAAFPGEFVVGGSLWQKRRWAFALPLAIFVALFVFLSLPGSSIGVKPETATFLENISLASGSSLILLIVVYSTFFERIIAFDDTGGTLSNWDDSTTRFEWDDLLAAGTVQKRGIWALTQAGNIHWLSTWGGYDNVLAHLRKNTGDRFCKNCDPHSVMQRDRATDCDARPAPPSAERIYARISLKYSWLMYLMFALPTLVVLDQLFDVIYGNAVAWGMMIVWIPAVAIYGGVLLLTLFRRRYVELSPEGWRRCGFTRGKLIEWRYCSHFFPAENYGVSSQYGPEMSVRSIKFYGHPPEELADRLNAYRERALAAMGQA